MSILVTGGAGYIGAHTVRLLREHGRDVVVLDSMELGHKAALLGAPLVVGDIADAPLVTKVVADHDVDAVIHFAAYKSAGESMLVPGKYFTNNAAGAFALLGALQASGVDRFVFSSTCAVYGSPKVLPVSEDAPLTPESPYGESKLMVERALKWFDVCHGFRSVSLRYFNAAGASLDAAIGEDWTVTLNLVPIVMKAALERRPPLEVYGTDYPTADGTAVRDYIHVDDLAEAHRLALEYLERGGETTAVNVGTGVGSTVQQVIDVARDVSGVRIPAEYVGRRAGDPVSVYADNRKAKAVLGWVPAFGLEDVVSSAWRWHSTHLDGYDDAG